jgi:hypothetical protein
VREITNDFRLAMLFEHLIHSGKAVAFKLHYSIQLSSYTGFANPDIDSAWREDLDLRPAGRSPVNYSCAFNDFVAGVFCL